MLAEYGSEAKVLAGGQSLIPVLAMRLAEPAHLVDINRDRRPGHRHQHPGRGDRRGAGPPLPGRARRGGRPGPAAAAAGTAAGGAPDHPEPGHHRRLAGARGSCRRDDGRAGAVRRHGDGGIRAGGVREIAAADFFRGPLESALEPDELATQAFFPALPVGRGLGLRRDCPPARRLRALRGGGHRGAGCRRVGRQPAVRVPVGQRHPARGGPRRRLAVRRAGRRRAGDRAPSTRSPTCTQPPTTAGTWPAY